MVMPADSTAAEYAAPAMSGPTSWADIDAQHAADEAAEVAGQFQCIIGGIMCSGMTLDEQAAAITAAAAELPARVRGEMQDAAKAIMPGRLARFLGAKVTNSDGLGPDDFAVVPDPDKPSTWKLQISDKGTISGAIQALSPAGFRGNTVELAQGERTKAIGRIRAAINKLSDADKGNLPDRLAALKALDELSRDGSIVLMPGAKAGEYDRFALWASNNFRDRTGEIFPAEAINGAVDRFNAREGVKGAANIWHVGHPKYGWPDRSISDWGTIEHAAYVDGFLFVEGPVTNQRAAAHIAEWAKSEPLGTSIEFDYWNTDLSGGVYANFDFDRVSVLPRAVAANPWTPLTTITLSAKGDDMPFIDDKQREAIATIWGEDQAKAWEAAAQTRAAELRARGIDAKSLDAELPATTITLTLSAKDDPEPETAPEPAPAASVTDDAPPKWAADFMASVNARLDQQAEAVKAVAETSTGARGVLGNSVQFTTSDDAKARAIADFRAADSGHGLKDEWGSVVAGIAGDLMGTNGQAPAGA